MAEPALEPYPALPHHALTHRDLPSTEQEPMGASVFHVTLQVYCIGGLRHWFYDRRDVLVAGDSFVYYDHVAKDGQVEARSINPDVFVVFGVAHHRQERGSYVVWDEGPAPAFVMEIASKSTKGRDKGVKRHLYAEMGVSEYFLLDARKTAAAERLQGFQLCRGRYVPSADGGVAASGGPGRGIHREVPSAAPHRHRKQPARPVSLSWPSGRDAPLRPEDRAIPQNAGTGAAWRDGGSATGADCRCTKPMRLVHKPMWPANVPKLPRRKPGRQDESCKRCGKARRHLPKWRASLHAIASTDPRNRQQELLVLVLAGVAGHDRGGHPLRRTHGEVRFRGLGGQHRHAFAYAAGAGSLGRRTGSSGTWCGRRADPARSPANPAR